MSFVNLKERAKKLKIDIPAIFIALRKKETPIIVKILAGITIFYALSPIDLIPDFIPVLGYLDDVILLPALIALTIRFIPDDVFADCREQAEGLWADGKPTKWYMLIIFIPILTWERWMFYWIGIIALVRFISLGIGFTKYHTLAFIHTYANKATGIILFFFPFLLFATGLTATAFVMCSIANLSALEELIINIKSRSLNRNAVSMFRSNDKSMQ